MLWRSKHGSIAYVLETSASGVLALGHTLVQCISSNHVQQQNVILLQAHLWDPNQSRRNVPFFPSELEA